MGEINSSDIILTPLKIISSPLGEVMHSMKCDDPGYAGFGESYFSTVKKDCVKGWKLHKKMVLNFTVAVGSIKFVIFNQQNTFEPIKEIILNKNNYQRLTVPNGLWVAFQGLEIENILHNFASLKHDPTEVESLPIDNNLIPYKNWS